MKSQKDVAADNVAAEVMRPFNVAAEVMRPKPRGHLPRLPPEFYRGHAFVFWTHTIANRTTGWLDTNRRALFREHLLHAAVREQLLCPIYVQMPDHVHLIWIGISDASDQRNASKFLRTTFEPQLAPARWQKQAHDRVLREADRERGAFRTTCAYITENPVRQNLVERADQWPSTGCVVPGFPDMNPFASDYWDLFWRIHAACVERGHLGKL